MKKHLNIVFLEAKTSDYDFVVRLFKDTEIDFTPSLAQSNEQFSELIENFKPDLVLCNQNLAPFGIEDAIIQIDQSEKNIPFILVNISLKPGSEYEVESFPEKSWVYKVHISDLLEKIQSLFNLSNTEILSAHDVKSLTRFQDLLLTVYHKSPNAICVSRLSDGVIVDFNHTLSKKLKYEEYELLGKTGLELGFWPSELERDMVVNAIKDNGSLKDFSGFSLDKFGTVIYYQGSFELVEIQGVEYLLSNFQDVTEKTKAKKDLEISENQYRLLAENATDMISRLNDKVKFTYMSPASESILGYLPEEMIGKFAFEFIHEDDLQFINYAYKQLISTQESIIITYRKRRKDGVYIWIESKASAVQDVQTGAVHEIIAVSRDITKRKKIEDALIESEYYYRLLAENSSDMISRHSPEGVYHYISPASFQLFGYHPDELVGRNAFNFIHEEEVEELKKTMQLVIEEELPKTLVYRYKNKDGKYVWIESTNKVLYDKNSGEVSEIVSVSRNITQRKQVEDKLKEKIKDLDTFIYRSSHDLKGPISSMKGLINMAKMEIDNVEANEFFEMMEKSVSHLDSILMDLLSITKIAQGQKNLTVINFDEAINEILLSLQNLPNFSKIKFSKKIIQQHDFMGDRSLINNILQNLILNSIVYRNSEQILGNTKIEITEKETFLEIIIEDDAEGIPVHMQDKVYEMFYRGNLKSSGTGLGLYIVKTAIEKLEGSIVLQSTVNVGTKFIIHLPIS